MKPELKLSFLLSHFGSRGSNGHSLYETYRSAIPREQLPAVVKKIDDTTSLGLFEGFAARDAKTGGSPALRVLLDQGKLESFEFRAHRFPEGGKRVRLGSPADEAGRNQDEDLVDVILTKPFEMQATPVTQLQWSLVMGENPSHFKTGGQAVKIKGKDIPMNPNRPVENVSWEDAQKFIQKLNEMDPHFNYRLPSEAEWEYAARAGTDTPYSFGSDPNDLGAYGWYDGNSGGQTHDVASLSPNADGLYDMHGNVLEWVQDWLYVARPRGAVDPTGPARGAYRVFRGGSWYSDPRYLRSAQRGAYGPGDSNAGIGFRLVREPK